MSTIYTLELENKKYYVGKSIVPKERILNHFYQNGSEWTKLHKPISILSTIKGDSFDEEKHTLKAMILYGIDNVRGGSYCKIQLSQFEKKKALQTIRSVSDQCYTCGEKGHFAIDCKYDKNHHEEEKECNKTYNNNCNETDKEHDEYNETDENDDDDDNETDEEDDEYEYDEDDEENDDDDDDDNDNENEEDYM